MQPLFHLDELGNLALHQPRDRDPGPLRDDARDVFFGDLFVEQRMSALQLPEARVGLLQLLFDLDGLPVAKLSRLGEVGGPFRSLGVGAHLLQLGLQGADLRDGFLLLVPARTKRGALL